MKKKRQKSETKRNFLFLMFMAFMLPGAAWAQEESEAPIPETGKVFTLGEVVVTGEGERGGQNRHHGYCRTRNGSI